MARITVEDCVDLIPNRYELVALSAERARAVTSGAPIMVSKDNDKPAVIALREIAETYCKPEDLKELLLRRLRGHNKLELNEDDMPTVETSPIEPEDYSHEGLDIYVGDSYSDLDMEENLNQPAETVNDNDNI